MRLVATVMLLVIGAGLGASCASDEGEIKAPQMSLDVDSEETYVAGVDVVLIHINATDPQDMDLEFEAVDPPERAAFESYRNQAVFEWDPIVSDVTDDEPHRLVFTVTNEAGLSAERTVHVHVEAAEDGSRFVNSSSQLYNPTSEHPLQFEVRVVNDAAPQVVLSMPPSTAPEGATLEQTGDFEGIFEWMPNPEQAEQRIHHVIFEADDGDEIVEQEVTIVIQDPDIGGTSPPSGENGGEEPAEPCTEEPIIDHVPLEAQRTPMPYSVKGAITDTSRDWEEVVLYWTMEDPVTDDPEYHTEVLDTDDGAFAGQIPNPELDPGEAAQISYALCAVADDGQEDDFTCLPEEFVYRFNAYSPDEEQCLDDGIDLSDPESAGEISTLEWESYQVCGEAPKYHALELAAEEWAEIVVSYPADTAPKIDVIVDDEPMEFENYACIGLASAIIDGPADIQVRVVGDELPYHITAFGESGPGEPVEPEECPGEEYEPNDTPAQATLITDNFEAYEEMAICTEDDLDVFATRLVRGDHFDAFLFFDHADGDLDMTLFAPSQAGDVVEGGSGVAQGWSTDDDESISYVAEESGFYYLSVMTSSEPNEYELMVERSCMVDDEFAGNHTLADAAPIDADEEYEGLKLCEGQPDVFRLTHQGTADVTWLGEAVLDYGSEQAVEVAIYDESGDLVAEGEEADGRVEFMASPEADQALDIEVSSSQPIIYDLVVVEIGD